LKLKTSARQRRRSQKQLDSKLPAMGKDTINTKNISRFLKMSASDQLGAISSNLRRLSNWTYDKPDEEKLKLIEQFLDQTASYTQRVDSDALTQPLQERFAKFNKELKILQRDFATAMDNNCRRLVWAEKMLDWSNFLS